MGAARDERTTGRSSRRIRTTAPWTRRLPGPPTRRGTSRRRSSSGCSRSRGRCKRCARRPRSPSKDQGGSDLSGGSWPKERRGVSYPGPPSCPRLPSRREWKASETIVSCVSFAHRRPEIGLVYTNRPFMVVLIDPIDTSARYCIQSEVGNRQAGCKGVLRTGRSESGSLPGRWDDRRRLRWARS